MEKDVIKALNSFLEGHYMAIQAYDNYIEAVQQEDLKNTLQIIQQNHKKHAMLIAKRIQDLEGTPMKSAGFMKEITFQLKGKTKNDDAIIIDALEGEKKGSQRSKEILAGKIDEESIEIATHILNAVDKHIDLLAKWAT